MTLPEPVVYTVIGLVAYVLVISPFVALFHLFRNRDPDELRPTDRTLDLRRLGR